MSIYVVLTCVMLRGCVYFCSVDMCYDMWLCLFLSCRCVSCHVVVSIFVVLICVMSCGCVYFCSVDMCYVMWLCLFL